MLLELGIYPSTHDNKKTASNSRPLDECIVDKIRHSSSLSSSPTSDLSGGSKETSVRNVSIFLYLLPISINELISSILSFPLIICYS